MYIVGRPFRQFCREVVIEPNLKLECVPKFCYLGDTLGVVVWRWCGESGKGQSEMCLGKVQGVILSSWQLRVHHTAWVVVVVVFIFNMACEQSINLVDTYVIHSVFSNYIDWIIVSMCIKILRYHVEGYQREWIHRAGRPCRCIYNVVEKLETKITQLKIIDPHRACASAKYSENQGNGHIQQIWTMNQINKVKLESFNINTNYIK